MLDVGDKNKESKVVQLDRKNRCSQVKEPHKYDIVCGRGGIGMYHTGNCILLKLVACLKPVYIKSSRPEKMKMLSNIVQQWPIQYPPGRFLKAESSLGLWICLTEREMKKKVGQLLRRQGPEIAPSPSKHFRCFAKLARMIVMKPEDKRYERTVLAFSSPTMLPAILPVGFTTGSAAVPSCSSLVVHRDFGASSSASKATHRPEENNDDAVRAKEDDESLLTPRTILSNLRKETKKQAGDRCDEVRSSDVVDVPSLEKSTSSFCVSGPPAEALCCRPTKMLPQRDPLARSTEEARGGGKPDKSDNCLISDFVDLLKEPIGCWHGDGLLS